MKRAMPSLLVLIVICSLASIMDKAWAQQIDERELNNAFSGAKSIDLQTCDVPSVVKLREVVEIPPPTVLVLVKTFNRESIPDVLKSVFEDRNIRGMTIAGRYVAILECDFKKEYDDILSHELVHAYITLASPGNLPFWFQEGSAVLFSTGKNRKFYGKPSERINGATEGKTVELPENYQQKLQSMQFLRDQVGEGKFNKWYRDSVKTGNVDARPLLGMKKSDEQRSEDTRRAYPVWLFAIVGIVVLGVLIAGYIVYRSQEDML